LKAPTRLTTEPKLHRSGSVAVRVTFEPNNAQDIRMNPIDLIITVCAVLSPTTCEETHLTFSYSGSLRQCAMAAPPYIAQWVGEHPKWTAVKWRCEYPHTNDKVENSGATPAG
jgi:hypothetical protein